VGYRLGDFEITGEIAAGYRARDRDLGRDVAIQRLPEDASIRAYQRRARALASLDHPNIGSVYDVVVARERPYLVAELVEGETLEEILLARELPVGEVVSIARQLTSALASAHDHGVVHGGLSRASVIVGADGRVKLVGFGLASAPSADPDGPLATSSARPGGGAVARRASAAATRPSARATPPPAQSAVRRERRQASSPSEARSATASEKTSIDLTGKRTARSGGRTATTAS